MFTGIIQDIGKIEFYHLEQQSLLIGISTKISIDRLQIGASVACNGCCLTVVKVEAFSEKNLFYANVGPTSLALTRFAQLSIGCHVNLEPALRLGDALDGHQVSGHIDGVCKINSFSKLNKDFWKLSLHVDKKWSLWVVPKGSIAVCGISLTISHIENLSDGSREIEIMVIPHTFCNTILQFIAQETCIEVEFDQTVKAIASLIQVMLPHYT